MELTLSFPVGILGDISHGELYKELYFNIKEVVHEQDVAGIQLYPSQWPRKVLITLKTKDAKEALMISGIDIMSQHIELRDEFYTFISIILFLPSERICQRVLLSLLEKLFVWCVKRIYPQQEFAKGYCYHF